jgi:hypothetical protein
VVILSILGLVSIIALVVGIVWHRRIPASR